MRIDDNNLQGISPSAAGASQQIRQADQKNSNAVQPGGAITGGDAGADEVHFSSLAGRVSAGHLSNDQAASAERSARIDRLAKLVQGGQYNPDPEKIADSMVRDMLSGPGSS